MKKYYKLSLVAIAGAMVAASVAYAAEINMLNFDFVAPTVPSVSDAPNQVGLIVYDSTNNIFMGRSNQAAPNDWQPLSPPRGVQVPTGTIIAFAGASAPSGYLSADGSAVSRTTYASLYAVIGTAYGEGDRSTTFNLPGLRGRFLRGVDGTAGRDPNSATRTAMNTEGNSGNNVGSVQTDAFQGHYHELYGDNNGSGTSEGWAGITATATPSNYVSGSRGRGTAETIFSDGTNGTTRTTSETRPMNAYVNYIIKY